VVRIVTKAADSIIVLIPDPQLPQKSCKKYRVKYRQFFNIDIEINQQEVTVITILIILSSGRVCNLRKNSLKFKASALVSKLQT